MRDIKKFKSLFLGMWVNILITTLTCCENCNRHTKDQYTRKIKNQNEVPLAWLKLDLVGLDAGEVINNNSSRFKIRVTSTAGQIIEADIPQISIQVSQDKDARIKGLTAYQITFKNEDLINGVIEREVEVIPGVEETEFVLELKHNWKTVATTRAKCKGSDAAYSLSFDRTDIDDGVTKIRVTVRKGKKVFQLKELERLQLAVKRTIGTAATIEGKDSDKLKFKNGTELTAAADNKSASRVLNINPGTDKEAEFEIELFDDQGKPIANTKQIIKWSNGAKLELIAAYDATLRTVTVKIKNSGKLNLGTYEAKLLWDTGENNITIKGNKTGNQDIPKMIAGATWSVILNNINFNNFLVKSTLELKITWASLRSDIVFKNIILAADPNIIQVLQAEADALVSLGRVSTLLGQTPKEFIKAAVEVVKAEANAQKAAEAVIVLGVGRDVTHPATKAAASAKQAATDARIAYDAAYAVAKSNEQKAMNAAAIATAELSKVNVELSKTNPDYGMVKASLDTAEKAANDSADEVKALGVGGYVTHVATRASLVARQAVDDAKKAIIKKATEWQEEAEKQANSVNDWMILVQPQFVDTYVLGNVNKEAGAAEVATKACEDAVTALGTSAPIELKNASVAARAAANIAKAAYQALVVREQEEADFREAYKSSLSIQEDVQKYLKERPKKFKGANDEIKRVDAVLVSALIAQQKLGKGKNISVDGALQNLTESLKNAKAIYVEKLEEVAIAVKDNQQEDALTVNQILRDSRSDINIRISVAETQVVKSKREVEKLLQIMDLGGIALTQTIQDAADAAKQALNQAVDTYNAAFQNTRGEDLIPKLSP